MTQQFEISFSAFAGISTIIFLFAESYKIRRGTESKSRLYTKIIFFIYFLGVSYYTFFPMIIDLYGSGFNFNTRPLVETVKVLKTDRSIGLYNVLGNIALLLPLGIFLPLLYRKANNFFIAVAIILSSTISIEFLQILTCKRIGDVDDIIFNTIGGIVGFCIYQIFRVILLITKKETIISEIQKENGSIVKSAIILLIPIILIMFFVIELIKRNYIN